ncbi:MAG: 2-oxoglutarate dehydrogenase E1 component, partial [Chthoniobacteraceae bacterium]|nr:2-oxoglutarate dehydrogenase E1 component [Chthoniobacteraceae bacterium]
MRTSLVNAFNAGLLEETYERWKRDPASVDANWSAFFEGFELGSSPSQAPGPAGALLKTAPVPAPGVLPAEAGALPPIPPIPAGMRPELPLQTRVDGLVYAYRTLGHTIARLDPLREERPEQPLLSLRELGFSEKDLDLVVASKFFRGGESMRLREMIGALRRIYCGAVGVEFMHIQNGRVRNWIRDRLESRPPEESASTAVQKAVLRELLEAESFEHFLHTRYVGQKRFSLQGAESLMVILQALLEECPVRGVEEIVMGMAHRGRLTVLANFLKKSLRVIFSEFSENYVPEMVAGDGDVKYHLGYQSARTTRGGKEIEIRLASNPSHLEAGDPVVIGMARARQRVRGDTEERAKVLPLLVHGDAAFAGQGIVAEVLNSSQLPGYRVGGTLHIIVNNQIGFTTLPAEARSSAYATDVAKMIEAPVFHVNGDDPLAVLFVTGLAFAFRQQFHRDAVVDMLCYRRYGHNEGDEPNFTQPDLYALIDKHPSVGKLFARQLAERGILSPEEADALDDEYEKRLETTLEEVRRIAAEPADRLSESTAVFQPPYSHDPVETGVAKAELDRIVAALTRVPGDFHILPKLQRLLLDRRAKAHAAGGPYDWAFGEALAFGSLLLEGTPVRLSGQDSQRGTFSQRHAVLFDAETGAPYTPLQHMDPRQARLCIYNSLLSEAAVLGFDYGYSINYPTMLCLWEAQFGDFANGAQVIIDQFIASAESKWQRPSGIVLLLPHGYEGQGPEHSSARVERFLQLCAEENLQIADPTTPAQYFHLLRRQMKRPFLKPLIVMTPKSLLRAEACVSTIADFTQDRFHEILPGPLLGTPEQVERVVFCTGKVYYDLLAYRQAQNRVDTAFIRVEQLYPVNETALKEAVAPFVNAKKFVWCQEEPQNMGAWTFISPKLGHVFHTHLTYAGRGE